MKTFTEKVLAIVGSIPKGSVLTYQEVAKRAGNAQAARAAGTILRKNHDINIPCHRVVRSDGDIGEYNQGRNRKITRLKSEGIKVCDSRVVFLWINGSRAGLNLV